MPERWILNASPLIVLARANQASLLVELVDQVVIPRLVALEIEAGPTDDRAKKVLADARFTIVDTPPPPPEILAWDLGSGESAVLSFALAEEGWTAIVDDAAARKCARSLSLPVRGTLGVVILARQRALIPSAADVLFGLQTAGFYLHDEIVRRALERTVGEEWPP